MKKPISLVPIVKPLTGKKLCKGIHKLVCRAKDSEKLLSKTKKRKRKENIASDESIGVYKSPSEFEQRPTTRKGNDDERLLVKDKRRKIKMNRISDESIGACESSEFEKGSKTQKGNDDERLLVKAKKWKIKMNRISDESIVTCESSEFEKGSKIQKGKDGERLLVKAKKRKIKENRTSDESIGACESVSEFEKGPKTQNGRRSAKVDSWQSSIHSETLSEIENFIEPEVDANDSKTKTRKFKKDSKHKKKHFTNVKESSFEEVQRFVDEEKVDEISSVDDYCTRGMKMKFKKDSKHKKKHFTNVKESSIEEVQRLVDEEKVDEISSVDDDCTRGIKKWLTQYKESRPGLKVLQQRIDDFVTAHEERLEQERKEREARAADDGWTVVVHQKGRKKTTDAETGTAVGSVASAAVMDKMSKKKSKEIALDFYRFQKREAKRNEVLMLQNKFEQDKKRIQQLRAARKFRPS